MEKISGYDPYNIHKEANDIANGAFFRDYEKDLEALIDMWEHAEGCGCAACVQGYQAQMEAVAIKYVVPIEE